MTTDSSFNEADHPRGQPGNAGQFGSGGSGESEKPAAAPEGSAQTQKQLIKSGRRAVKLVEAMKIGSNTDTSVADDVHTAVEEFESLEHIKWLEQKISEITPEQRAELKEDEEFTWESDLREAYEALDERADKVGEALNKFVARTAKAFIKLGGEGEIPDAVEIPYLPDDISKEDIAVLEELLTGAGFGDMSDAIYEKREALESALDEIADKQEEVDQITAEERADLKEGEVFEAEQDLEQAVIDAENGLEDLRAEIEDAATKSHAALVEFAAKVKEIDEKHDAKFMAQQKARREIQAEE